jgi:hypothetical protein
LKQIRKRLTYANVMSSIAVFLLLGGATAFAALGKNSVGTKQLKKNAVNSSKVKNHSLLSVDFKAGQLPAGPQGPKGEKGEKGEKGATGEAGTARGYAHVDGATGVVTLAKNIATANVEHIGGGAYCLSGLSFSPENVVVTPESPGGNFDGEVGIGPGPSACPAATQVRIFFRNSAGTLTDKSFFVLLN